MVWRHGYVVSVLSYDAADGKDVAPVLDAPPIGFPQLMEVAHSEAWFE